MPKGYYTGNKGHKGNGKSGNTDSGPVIFRPTGFETVKAITVYVAKTCKYKTISVELMLFVIEALADMLEGKGYQDRKQYRFKPSYFETPDIHWDELWAKVDARKRR